MAPTDNKLTVTLEVQQWRQVLQFIGHAPVSYLAALPIIQVLEQQLNAEPRPDNVVNLGEASD